ncbi:uncharacterized protein LOC135205225 [Macrobrachium nipponense]|uniref:uncharacterized protein LOC135205225 n=1 Tax=Macrobrachium nipponense TaxID=159736 RepID=UPI0030C8766A
MDSKMLTLVLFCSATSLAMAASSGIQQPPAAQTPPPPAVYEVLGVLELESTPSKHDQIMTTMLDILPDINRMMQAMTVDSTISANTTEGERTRRVHHIIQTAIAMSRMILEAHAEADGSEVSTEDLQRLKAVETEAYKMAQYYMANYLSTLPNCYCTETEGVRETSVASSGEGAPPAAKLPPPKSKLARVEPLARPVARAPPPPPAGSVNFQPVSQPSAPQNLQFNSLSNLLKSLPVGTRVL